MLQHTATHCFTLQHAATQLKNSLPWVMARTSGIILMHCNTLQHTATCCNSMEHTHYLESWLGLRESFWCAWAWALVAPCWAVWRDSFTCVTWLIYMCDMTHIRKWRIYNLLTCVKWLIQMRDMTHSNVWHDSFKCVTWLIYMCDMTHLHEWCDSFKCVTWLI